MTSCQIHHGANREVRGSTDEEIPAPAGARLHDHNSDWRTRSFPIRLLAQPKDLGIEKQDSPMILGDILTERCTNADEIGLQLRLTLKSPFGSELIRLTLKRKPDAVAAPEMRLVGPNHMHALAPPPTRNSDDVIDADVGHGIIRIPLTENSPYFQLRSQGCKNNEDIIADPTLLKEIENTLTKISPDCQRIYPDSSSAGGYQCDLPESAPEKTKRSLEDLRTQMIQRWSRQPYLLARRLALTLQLAEALQSPQPETALSTFCKIIKHSLNMELSATFTSERWQQTVCSLDTPAATRRSAALFGLSKSQTEIDFLRQLFERTSKLGTLTLQLPNQAAASGEIWVSLRPELDVAERLANEASRLWHGDPRKKSPEQNTKPPGSCWHPLYSDNQNLMMLARHLTLTGNQSDVECFQQPESSQNTAAPSRYVTDSITSETEFITPNRRSKTLRLPVGTYHYELRGMPNDPSEWDDAAQAETRTAGRIVWDDKKTRPVISVW